MRESESEKKKIWSLFGRLTQRLSHARRAAGSPGWSHCTHCWSASCPLLSPRLRCSWLAFAFAAIVSSPLLTTNKCCGIGKACASRHGSIVTRLQAFGITGAKTAQRLGSSRRNAKAHHRAHGDTSEGAARGARHNNQTKKWPMMAASDNSSRYTREGGRSLPSWTAGGPSRRRNVARLQEKANEAGESVRLASRPSESIVSKKRL